jgi:membrane protein YqaA with SNARE-associated domain
MLTAILFLVALASNATPFFGASYTLLATTALYTYGVTFSGFATVVVVTAAGASLGKLVLYATGRGMKNSLRKNRNIGIFDQWLEQKRRSLLLVFATAIIPAVPLDDYVFIAAGASKAKLRMLISVTFLAKLLKSFIEIGLEVLGLGKVFNTSLFGMSRLETSIFFSGLFIIAGIAFYRIDFDKLLGRLGVIRHTSITASTSP